MGRMKKSKVHPHSVGSSDQETLEPVQTTNERFGEVLESKLRRQNSKALIKAEERLRQKGLQVAHSSHKQLFAVTYSLIAILFGIKRIALFSLLNGALHSFMSTGGLGSAPALHLHPISCGCCGVVDVCSVCGLVICCSK